MTEAQRTDVLTKFKLVGTKVLAASELRDARFDVTDYLTWNAEALVGRVVARVYGRDVQDFTFSWPADWWQAVKERFAPRWVLSRWPVRYTRRQLTVRELYPTWTPLPTEHFGPAALDLVDTSHRLAAAV